MSRSTLLARSLPPRLVAGLDSLSKITEAWFNGDPSVQGAFWAD